MCILQNISLEIQQLWRDPRRGQRTLQREWKPQHFKVHSGHGSGKQQRPPIKQYTKVTHTDTCIHNILTFIYVLAGLWHTVLLGSQ